MEKKNTILLTVIAVATLLVAVVGASFAFFAVQETNTGAVDVTTTTAKASDIFKATGTGALGITVTNDAMLEANSTKGQFLSDTDSSMVVSLQAGSGKASCTYKLTYTETGAAYKKSKVNTGTPEVPVMTDVEGNEYTLSGVAKNAEGQEIAGLTVAETNLVVDAESKTLVFGPFTIEDTYEEASAETTQTWTFTTKFYNLAADQKDQLDKSYSGNVKVTNVSCTNVAAQ